MSNQDTIKVLIDRAGGVTRAATLIERETGYGIHRSTLHRMVHGECKQGLLALTCYALENAMIGEQA